MCVNDAGDAMDGRNASGLLVGTTHRYGYWEEAERFKLVKGRERQEGKTIIFCIFLFGTADYQKFKTNCCGVKQISSPTYGRTKAAPKTV